MAQLGAGSGSGYGTGVIDTTQTWVNSAGAAVDGNTRLDAELVNDFADAIINIETVLGANPEAAYASVEARLDAYLPTSGAFTAGSIVFSNGTTFAQDNANLFWDDSNNRLGIGTVSPGSKLDIYSGASAFPVINASRNYDGGRLRFQYATTTDAYGEIGQTYSGPGLTKIWMGVNLNTFAAAHEPPTQGNAAAASWFSAWDTVNDRYSIERIAAAGGTTSTAHFIVNSSGNVGIGTASPTTRLDVVTSGTVNFGVTSAGLCFIGDESANANMTTGLTINQGAADNEILALKSSDVAHGMTSLTETDTFFYIQKSAPTTGGCDLLGHGAASTGVRIVGRAVTDNTVKTTGSIGYIDLLAQKKSGTTVTDAGADANLVTIVNNSTTRFIFDAEGSAHGDIEWVAFDDHDDIALLNDLQMAMISNRPDPITAGFGEFLRYNKDDLQATKVVNFYDEGPRAMVNFTRLAMLHTGALVQVGMKLEEYQKRIAMLETKLLETGDT